LIERALPAKSPALQTIFQRRGFILRDARKRAPQDKVLTRMVRSVATPRVSNHEAPWMRGHDPTQPEML